VNLFIKGLICAKKEFLSLLSVRAKAILLFSFFYNAFLATYKAFK